MQRLGLLSLFFLLVFFAIVVLLISIYKTTAIGYKFYLPNDSSVGQPIFVSDVSYSLPYPGILPNSPLWPLKVLRERLALYFTSDPLEKAQRTLFLADKRLAASSELFSQGDYPGGVATVTRAEKYLEEALLEGRDADVKGEDASGFFETLSKASLTHRQVLEEMMKTAPSDAKPVLNKTLDYPKSVYEQTMHALNERGKSVPTPTPSIKR